MKLLDQVAQARSPVEIEDATGCYRLAGAGEHAARLLACPVRFVVNDRASLYCSALVETDSGMLTGRNELLRVPSSLFWLERSCTPCKAEVAGSREGLLIQADSAGRAGTVTTFWEQRAGEPLVAQMLVMFNLDDSSFCQKVSCNAWALRPGSHPLTPYLLLQLQPDWQAYFDRQNKADVQRSMDAMAAKVMPGVEFLFAFSILLAERTCLSRREIDLSRLNRQRNRKARPALLDHAEVRLDLTPEPRAWRSFAVAPREAARLHYVRGHLVSRGGHTFWRRSHLRGDPSKPARVRTVHVTQQSKH